jgi:hypothetical protein
MPRYDTGLPLAELDGLSHAWVALSQYGYPLAWRKTVAEAVEYARAFYREHAGTIETPTIIGS